MNCRACPIVCTSSRVASSISRSSTTSGGTSSVTSSSSHTLASSSLSADALDNVAYFNGIEKVLSSIGLSISEAVMTFLNSGGVQNKDVRMIDPLKFVAAASARFVKIIDQCGHIRTRRQTFAIDQKFDDDPSKSILDRQLSSISHSLQAHRLFWVKLPGQICQSRGVSASNGSLCWSGTSLVRDGTSSRVQYDKPLSLKLQWILKEMKEKSQAMAPLRPSAPSKLLGLSPPLLNESKVNVVIENLTDAQRPNDLDDYPNDTEFDYSDYAYEDATDQTSSSTSTTTVTTTTTTTTTTRRTTTVDDDLSIDETNTAYYDYGDLDVYSDDEGEETSTTKAPVRPSSTRRIPLTTTIFDWKDRIPFYHRRTPIVWNINNNDDEKASEQRSNSASPLTYSLLLRLILFITARV